MILNKAQGYSNLRHTHNPRGHSHWKVVRGCATVITPFFHAIRCSLTYPFTVNAPLMCPPCPIFGDFAFLALFWPKFYLSRPKFSFPRPAFFQENLLFGPYFWKPVWHTPTKKVECLPPGHTRHPIYKQNIKCRGTEISECNHLNISILFPSRLSCTGTLESSCPSEFTYCCL